jgi:hypothetical protein
VSTVLRIYPIKIPLLPHLGAPGVAVSEATRRPAGEGARAPFIVVGVADDCLRRGRKPVRVKMAGQ